MNKRKITAVVALNAFIVTALSIIGTGTSYAAPETPRCLSYLTVGDSACDTTPEIEEPKEIILEEPIKKEEPQKKPEMTFDEKVDDFLENHGKPPREFVEFNLNPTLDNALRWAQKNREMMSRNKQIAAAWGQAKTILNEREAEGGDLPEFNELPEIPDYGVPLPDGFKSFMDNPEYKSYGQNDAELNAGSGALSIGGSGVKTTTLEGINLNASSATNGRIGGAVLNQAVVDGERVPISISYYFADEDMCRDCRPFEESFAKMVEDFGSSLSVTCVDMTRDKTGGSIANRINCSWRPLLRGEIDGRGIKEIPTIVIDRHMEGQPEEVVSGIKNVKNIREILSK